ncbi:iron-sulfur cluster co-chaperone protein HscB isoform X3 [Aquarana catesbeiana]|uniref:iron-sulfur cluster co-chaperone protein HscB isoform X3 n=1 Tax=Aquarana catesbeiana TaxID=8400 RepID=UPI003CCA32DF
MEIGCRAVWRRCAGHWRTCMAAVLSPAKVTRGVMCVRAPPLLSPAPWMRRRLCMSAQSRLCWSCQCEIRTEELFCPSCRSLQPPDLTRDYFYLLNCDRSFDVNVQELQKKYRDLQRSLHPDYFSQKPQLGLHGITFTEGTEEGIDAPFLFEILEVNEQLNEATTDAEIEEIGNDVQEKCQMLTENVKEAFQKGDLEGAKKFLTTMKYYTNILEQVKKKILP